MIVDDRYALVGSANAANELEDAIKKPGAKASWEKIQEVAAANTALYEAAFDFIPRNEDRFGSKDDDGNDLSASIWPTRARDSIKNIDQKTKKLSYKTMPFDKDFWTQKRFNQDAAVKLKAGIKGFITLLPIDWTSGENNNMNYAISLVADNDTSTSNNKA